MNNPQRNQRIRIAGNNRGYSANQIYTITKVDPSDNTLTATDSDGREGPWVKWDNCFPAAPNISWEWLKTQLPSEVLELLSAFNGLETLSLKPELRDYILSQLPNLKDRILQAQIALDEQFGGEAISGPSTPPAQDPEEEPCPF
jgi:hypothetical protein